jgi:hypothetical protein
MRVLLFAVLAGCAHAGGTEPARLRIRVTVSPAIASQAVSGRLLVLMGDANDTQPMAVDSKRVAIAASEARLIPGQPFDFDPDTLAYPKPLSQMPPGRYRFAAILDTGHNYVYHGSDGDDLVGSVVRADLGAVDLVLDRRGQDRTAIADNEHVKLAELQSPLLSAFWGRPMFVRAGVVLPPSYGTDPARRYPTMFHIHGFSSDYRVAWVHARDLQAYMSAHKLPEMIVVFLDGTCPQGHHEFADSLNGGPWARALTEEFIPYLESRFRMVPESWARFLTGHSSGGWSSLWLQVTHPDFFGGAWSTSPDPVDFRNFVGINLTPGSTDNVYRHDFIRVHGQPMMTFEEFAHRELVIGRYGGQLASFEWVFSPRGENGEPMRFFDRTTGALDQKVLLAWEKWDVRKVLERNWDKLGPALQGKLHIIVGAEDNFWLEEPVKLLCDFLAKAGSDAKCEIVPGRDHSDVYESSATYPEGLLVRIIREMNAVYEAHAR